MPEQPAELELLRALAPALEALGVRWYLFGAQAAIVYGAPRLSFDVDVTVELQDEDRPALVAFLRMAGFEPDIENDLGAFVRRTRVLPMRHAASGMALDVVFAGPGLEEEFLERARPTEIGDVVVPVISPEDLVVTKVLAQRPKDMEDVRAVLREPLA